MVILNGLRRCINSDIIIITAAYTVILLGWNAKTNVIECSAVLGHLRQNTILL